MAYASVHGFVIFTHDLDFGAKRGEPEHLGRG
jgi:predicted nuclease of predicted toxin-antitoxin system